MNFSVACGAVRCCICRQRVNGMLQSPGDAARKSSSYSGTHPGLKLHAGESNTWAGACIIYPETMKNLIFSHEYLNEARCNLDVRSDKPPSAMYVGLLLESKKQLTLLDPAWQPGYCHWEMVHFLSQKLTGCSNGTWGSFAAYKSRCSFLAHKNSIKIVIPVQWHRLLCHVVIIFLSSYQIV